MKRNNKLVKATKNLYQKLCSSSTLAIKEQSLWLLRAFLVTRKQSNWLNAGFVLPTVAMVALVVVLLTTAILFRSFERSKNASNVRVNEAVLNASMPALERAVAKLEQLLNDPSLPRSTPTDIAVYDIIKNNSKYNFGDETRLKLAADINGDGSIDTGVTGTNNIYTLENDERLNTAWKFPVDTDNNGKFDTYILYGIYFRSPTRNNTNKFNRSRSPLDARTPPMDRSQVGGACADSVGTSASLIGDSSWYKSSGNLAKSFFVYSVNVPIEGGSFSASSPYENYRGNRAFSALEYQQDRERIPVNNKAVWFENDLELTPGSNFVLNGSVHTNSNLLAGGQYDNVDITFRQISSKNSCFYEQENAKITIGGNIGTGNISDSTNKQPLTIHLFKGIKVDPATNLEIGGGSDEKSTTESGGHKIGHNDAAYNKRINKMREEALGLCTTCNSASTTTVAAYKSAVEGMSNRYPKEVIDNFKSRVDQTTSVDLDTAKKILGEELELYFRNRTMRVTFAKVSQSIPTDSDALGSTYATGSVFATSGIIDVPSIWREITSTNTNLTLKLDKLSGTEPEQLKEDGIENYTGDRIFVGNNLPAYWKNSNGDYVTGEKARQLVDTGTTKWDSPPSPKQIARTRASQIQPQLNLGVTDRNDFWEEKAAEDNAANPLANVGGLRTITGAGIYVDDDGTDTANAVYKRKDTDPAKTKLTSFLDVPTLDNNFIGSTTGKMPPPSKFKDAGTEINNIVTWSDTMPMTGGLGENRKGDLLMRATAVYHYKNNAGTAQTPIACVSSYYDPTNVDTAKNENALPWNNAATGKSNNGITYSFPGRTISSTQLTTLKRQARLVFPNGRIVNEPLRNAMKKYTSNGSNFNNFTLADYSAVDTALCALSIMGGSSPNDTNFAHGKIREASFLDAREVKALQNLSDYQSNANQGKYELDLEQRQPLEIRVTEIDLGYLASTTIGSNDYLLPKSGIIYATREDALSDVSYATVDSSASANEVKLLSQTDFKLDPTRRPNGIRLFNGSNLARGGTNSSTYDAAEKGLILVSNLPVYVKGEFNLHKNPTNGSTIEEFSDSATKTFYEQEAFDSNFACRPGRGGCPSTGGDLWRPATILADAITLLSGTFQDGYRNHGDYDVRDNTVTIPATSLVNNFVTSSIWAASNGYPDAANKTSYLANGVTPIQRRARFNEYLMEICVKVPASTCTDNDWYIRPPATSITQLKISDIATNNTVSLDITNIHQAGTTAQPAVSQYQRYARRVAFLRDASNQLLDANGAVIPTSNTANIPPVPLGISSSIKVQKYPYNTFATNKPRPAQNNLGLWFRTTDLTSGLDFGDTSKYRYNTDFPLFIQGSLPGGTQQPQLVPVLQIYSPEGTPASSSGITLHTNTKVPGIQKQWLQTAGATTTATSITFNGALVTGNSPSRPEEESAGLQNLVRFLEYWGGTGSGEGFVHTAKIRGSFIQFKRSSYATAPFASILSATASATATTASTNNLSIFNYPINTYFTNKGSPEGTLPYYTPPSRDWGFDAALLSQLPDLFAQRFTVPPSGPPAEYFREVNRDDPWLKTLLCAAEGSNYAVPQRYLPRTSTGSIACPTLPLP